MYPKSSEKTISTRKNPEDVGATTWKFVAEQAGIYSFLHESALLHTRYADLPNKFGQEQGKKLQALVDALFSVPKEMSKHDQDQSAFGVGASLLLEDGSIYTGYNSESRFRPNTGVHAEEMVLGLVVKEQQAIRALAVVGLDMAADASAIITPCGGCREKILEKVARQGQDIIIVMVSPDHEHILLGNMSALFPGYFGATEKEEEISPQQVDTIHAVPLGIQTIQKETQGRTIDILQFRGREADYATWQEAYPEKGMQDFIKETLLPLLGAVKAKNYASYIDALCSSYAHVEQGVMKTSKAEGREILVPMNNSVAPVHRPYYTASYHGSSASTLGVTEKFEQDIMRIIHVTPEETLPGRPSFPPFGKDRQYLVEKIDAQASGAIVPYIQCVMDKDAQLKKIVIMPTKALLPKYFGPSHLGL